MPRLTSAIITKSILLTTMLVVTAFTCLGQSTTGTVSMSATVSKFVEINSGGAVTLTGNSGGGVTTDGVTNSPLAVSINLGERRPSNTNSSGTSASRIVAADVGFGLGTVSRTGLGVNAGADTNATSGDPTLAANGSVNGTTGRYEFTAVRSNLNAFSSSTTALSGPIIMNAVPRSNTNGLTVPAFFAVKPQFFENGTTTISVTFTVTAP